MQQHTPNNVLTLLECFSSKNVIYQPPSMHLFTMIVQAQQHGYYMSSSADVHSLDKITSRSQMVRKIHV